MIFVHIATYTDAQDFTTWLTSQRRLAFNDSKEFKVWLDGQKVFPLEFYLNGVVLRLANEHELQLFSLGFELALDMRMKNGIHDA